MLDSTNVTLSADVLLYVGFTHLTKHKCEQSSSNSIFINRFRTVAIHYVWHRWQHRYDCCCNWSSRKLFLSLKYTFLCIMPYMHITCSTSKHPDFLICMPDTILVHYSWSTCWLNIQSRTGTALHIFIYFTLTFFKFLNNLIKRIYVKYEILSFSKLKFLDLDQQMPTALWHLSWMG